jgi:hypothetical protein
MGDKTAFEDYDACVATPDQAEVAEKQDQSGLFSEI